MKTAEQRVAAMHKRTEELSRRREKDILFLTAVCSCILLAVLVPVTAALGGLTAGGSGDGFTAASLLDESAGGYILAALGAFMAGVIITVICVKLKDRGNQKSEIRNQKWTQNSEFRIQNSESEDTDA